MGPVPALRPQKSAAPAAPPEPTAAVTSAPPGPIATPAAPGGAGPVAAGDLKEVFGHYAEGAAAPGAKAGAGKEEGTEEEKEKALEGSVTAGLGYNTAEKKPELEFEGEADYRLGKGPIGVGGYFGASPLERSFKVGPSLSYRFPGDRKLTLRGGYAQAQNEEGGTERGLNLGANLELPFSSQSGLELGLDYTRMAGRNDASVEAKYKTGRDVFGLSGTYSTDVGSRRIGADYMHMFGKDKNFGVGANISANPADLAHPTVGASLKYQF